MLTHFMCWMDLIYNNSYKYKHDHTFLTFIKVAQQLQHNIFLFSCKLLFTMGNTTSIAQTTADSLTKPLYVDHQANISPSQPAQVQFKEIYMFYLWFWLYVLFFLFLYRLHHPMVVPTITSTSVHIWSMVILIPVNVPCIKEHHLKKKNQ